MKYKIAIFDMDGTILNTIEDLCDSMNYCLDKYGMPERSLEEVTSFVGNGLRKLVERAVPQGTPDATVAEMLSVFEVYYKEHCAIKTRPYDGICDTIGALRAQGVITAVVSNKVEFGVRDLCKIYFPGLFDYYVGEREGQRKKPYPDAVFAVLDHFGIEKKDAVYIGDSDVDLATAKNAGTDVIMVGWGFRKEDFILSLGAPFVIHKPEEIIEKMQ